MTRRVSAESPRLQAANRLLEAEACKATPLAHAAVRRPTREPVEALPILSGSRPNYYLFQQGGHRMAVALLDKGARLRVNDAIDVVVLEIYNGSVKIGLVDRSRPVTTISEGLPLSPAAAEP